MTEEYNISFDALLGLCNRKIPAKSFSQPGTLKGAFNGGDYLGSPGKDIYFFLPRLTDEQFPKLVRAHGKQYPRTPPGNHVGTAACIRYIYGQFEKQGILRSKQDRKRMMSEKEKIDWSLSRKFIDGLHGRFVRKKHYYGLTILAEMEAHRLGDEAIMFKDDKKLEEMEKTYLDAVKYAHMCKSYKQMFTPYYWAACYFMLYGSKAKAIDYSKKTLFEAESHAPDARASYVNKLLDCAQYIKKNNEGKWRKWRKQLADRATSRCVKKMLKKIK